MYCNLIQQTSNSTDNTSTSSVATSPQPSNYLVHSYNELPSSPSPPPELPLGVLPRLLLLPAGLLCLECRGPRRECLHGDPGVPVNCSGGAPAPGWTGLVRACVEQTVVITEPGGWVGGWDTGRVCHFSLLSRLLEGGETESVGKKKKSKI